MGRAEIKVTTEDGQLIAFKHVKTLQEAFKIKGKMKKQHPEYIVQIDWAKH